MTIADLTAPAVPVRFDGLRAGEGPMTLGQLNILRWLDSRTDDDGEPEHASLLWPMRLPATGVGLADVAETVAALLGRHEGLRTTYLPGRRQRVAGTGELLIQVHPVDGDPEPPGALVDRLAARLTAQPYDRTRDLPMRVAVATRGDRVVAGLVGYSHLAVDRHAVDVLGRDFTAMVSDPAARAPVAPGHQPLDQAALEQSGPAERQGEETLRYWESRLRTMPHTPYAGPWRGRPTGESGAIELSSQAAADALRRIADRTRVSRPNAVLAAICALLSSRTGERSCVFSALSGNRYERRLAGYVGTLTQSSLFEVDIGEASFDELVRRAWLGAVRAGRYGSYDAFRLAEVRARIEDDRGISFHNQEPLFNNAVMDEAGRAAAEDAHEPAHPTTLRLRAMPAMPLPVRFDLWQVEPAVTLDLWSGDLGRVGVAEAETMLLALERLLLAAAGGDVAAPTMRDILGLAPIGYDEGWLNLDSCRVELAELRTVVNESLPGPTQVWSYVDGRPLVAYACVGDQVRTPRDAHTRCRLALAEHPTAMTPRWYVLSETAPADPTDLADWRRQPVVAAGTGRE